MDAYVTGIKDHHGKFTAGKSLIEVDTAALVSFGKSNRHVIRAKALRLLPQSMGEDEVNQNVYVCMDHVVALFVLVAGADRILMVYDNDEDLMKKLIPDDTMRDQIHEFLENVMVKYVFEEDFQSFACVHLLAGFPARQ